MPSPPHDSVVWCPLPMSGLELRSAARGGGVWFQASGPAEYHAFRLEIRVDTPVRIEVVARTESDEVGVPEAPRSLHWSMAEPTSGNAPPEDVFERAAFHVEGTLRSWASELGHPWRDYGRALLEARARVREAARRALAACDPVALAIARRFHRDARWFVYGRAAEDRSGRVAQLAGTCPGALLAASALDRRGAAEEADAIVRAAGCGRPLREVVSRAVEGWAAVRRREWLARPRLDHWRFQEESDAEAGMRAVLLGCAGPQVDPEHILVRPSPGFAREDIPSRPDRNAAWYRVTSMASWRLHRLHGFGESLGGFISRHPRAILGEARRVRPAADECDEYADEVSRVLERLIAYCVKTGRRPGRKSDPVRILSEVRRWHAAERQAKSPEGRLGAFLARVPALGLGPVVGIRLLGADMRWAGVGDLALPPWPGPDVSVRGLTVSAIRTAVELAQEGTSMRHCVASLLGEVMGGKLFVFSVRTPASRLTLALRRRLDGTYDLSELRGIDDRTPLAVEHALVGRWVERVSEGVNERDLAARRFEALLAARSPAALAEEVEADLPSPLLLDRDAGA